MSATLLEGWPGAPGGIFLERHLVPPPRLEHRRDDAPALHRRVAPHRQHRLTAQDALEHLAVGRQLAGPEVALQGCRVDRERVAGATDVELEGDTAGVEGDADAHPIGAVVALQPGRDALRWLEGHRHLPCEASRAPCPIEAG